VLVVGTYILCYTPGSSAFISVNPSTYNCNHVHFHPDVKTILNPFEPQCDSNDGQTFQSWSSLNVLFRKSSNKLKKDGEEMPKAEDLIDGQASAKPREKRLRHFPLKNPFRTAIRSTAMGRSTDLDTSTNIHTPSSQQESGSLYNNNVNSNNRSSRNTGCRIVETQAEGFFRRRSAHMSNLRIYADPLSNSLSRLIRGVVGTVHVTFDRLAFNKISMSGGGRFSIPNGADFALLSLNPGPTNWVKRFPNDFRLDATSVIFTQEDIMNSFYIKRGIELMLNRILKTVLVRTMGKTEGSISVNIHKVEIKPNGKLSCRGSVTPLHGMPIPFEVLTKLKPSKDGRILHFPGIEIAMHHQNSNLTPTLNLPPIVNVPIHAFFPVDLDVGKNANIQKIVVDGKRKRLEISMSAIITPLKLDVDRIDKHTERNGNEEYVKNAKFHCDVGRWITKIGKFAY